ncbi:alcohol dehydrogenase, partial [Globisporangium splendens]
MDINATNGFYGNTAPPFGCGLEAAGIATELWPDAETFKVGDAVVYQMLTPAVLPLAVCGVSASIALEQVGEMKQGGETILVTAGDTVQFVVQLAKLAGNHAIGTCNSDEKVEILESLGCDRVIKEDVNAMLKTEYPNGFDIVFETVGGDMFKAAVENIATQRHIIVFGFISGYKGDNSALLSAQVNPMLHMKSVSVRGFLLCNHTLPTTLLACWL